MLAAGKHVDGKTFVLDQDRVGVGAVIGAEQHQSRVHRQRTEGAGGQADDLPVVIQGGDHGHSGRERTHDLFVDGGIDHWTVLGSGTWFL
ncbi:hypothetical protein D9M72_603480 [compost metagenome]